MSTGALSPKRGSPRAPARRACGGPGHTTCCMSTRALCASARPPPGSAAGAPARQLILTSLIFDTLLAAFWEKRLCASARPPAGSAAGAPARQLTTQLSVLRHTLNWKKRSAPPPARPPAARLARLRGS